MNRRISNDWESQEKKVYDRWIEQNAFNRCSDSSSMDEISLLLPPPNVTGTLHIGHALTVSIQDAFARYYRMNGRRVKWIPGTDHAGIATQTVVEKNLADNGIKRLDLGRDKFLLELQTWKEKSGSRIMHQIRRLGASLDWRHEFFTLDPQRSEAVTKAFVQLYEDGLIYRDNRMVNWSCALGSAISDIEVDWQKVNKGTTITVKNIEVRVGLMHTVAYKVAKHKNQEIVVSTTRPETIWGDRAIAVHPDDQRYKDLHGELVNHPLLPGVLIPIIPDSILVDMDFGTGAVKVTPAHDAKDFDFAKRHPLVEAVSIFNNDGLMTAECGNSDIVGLDRLAVRDLVLEMLKSNGLYRGVVAHEMSIGRCSRTGDLIEQMVRPQWYLRMKPLAEKLHQRRSIKIGTRQHAIEWKRWLDNLQDWCLSRQIWWGHRVPAFYSGTTWVVAENKEKAMLQILKVPEYAMHQDPDVLDAWFSSSLLPLSAFGWPEKAPSPYPLEFIESGSDILFFWVARMALLSTYFANDVPFKEIMLHPLIRDSKGRKMSKSLGNVIDPLNVMDGCSLKLLEKEVTQSRLSNAEKKAQIQELRRQFPNGMKGVGADALRFSLLNYTSQSHQITLEWRAVADGFSTINKINNIATFYCNQRSLHHLLVQDHMPILHKESPFLKSYMDSWICTKFNSLQSIIKDAFESRQLASATKALRHFLIKEFSDVYVQYIKHDLNPSAEHFNNQKATASIHILQQILHGFLKLMHPFAPFITEVLANSGIANIRIFG